MAEANESSKTDNQSRVYQVSSATWPCPLLCAESNGLLVYQSYCSVFCERRSTLSIGTCAPPGIAIDDVRRNVPTTTLACNLDSTLRTDSHVSPCYLSQTSHGITSYTSGDSSRRISSPSSDYAQLYQSSCANWGNSRPRRRFSAIVYPLSDPQVIYKI